MFRRFAISTINSAYYIGMYLYFIFFRFALMSLNVFQHFSCFVAIYTAILCILLKCEVVTLEMIVLSTKMTALSRAIEYLVQRIKAKRNK